LSHAGSARRRQNGHDRQPCAEPVHHRARLVIRLGGVAGPDAARHAAGGRLCANRRRGFSVKGALGLYAALIYLFLDLPLAILAVFSFNSSRYTLWEGASLVWYRAVFHDSNLAEAAANSVVIALGATAL